MQRAFQRILTNVAPHDTPLQQMTNFANGVGYGWTATVVCTELRAGAGVYAFGMGQSKNRLNAKTIPN